MQQIQFIVDSFTSEEEVSACPNPQFCNCGRDGCCEEGCECGCTKPSCNCCAGKAKYDTIYIDLPRYFVLAKNPHKYVSILIVRLFDLTTNQEITSSMHSNLIRTNESADDYCCTCNMLYPIPKKYPMPDNKGKFEVWFRRINGSIIDLDPTKTRCVIELTLEY